MAKSLEEIKAAMAALKASLAPKSEPAPENEPQPPAREPSPEELRAAEPTAESRQIVTRGTSRVFSPGQRAREAEQQKGPPHSVEAEHGVLGSMLHDPIRVIPLVEALGLSSHFFYSPIAGMIFDRLLDHFRVTKKLDIRTFTIFMEQVGHLEKVGGPAFITSLFTGTPSADNITYYIDNVRETYLRRQMIASSNELARRAADKSEDVGELMVVAQDRVGALGFLSGPIKTALTVRTLNQLVGMTFDERDNYFGDRIIAAGQPCTLLGPGGIGKSRLSMQMAVCMITGREFLGMATTRGRGLKWLFIQTENNNRRLHFDLKNLISGLALTPDEVAEVDRLLFIHTLENDLDAFINLINPANYAAVNGLIQDVKPDITQWDPLNSLTDNDLNSDMDMRAVVSSISRITRHGNVNRVPLVLHHSLTGKVGAARAVGWDKASYGRNSKVLQAWTRAQINLAPRSADDTDLLIMSCGKNNNGKAFPEIGVRFDPDKGIYLEDDSFDAAEFREEVGLSGSTRSQYKRKYSKDMLLEELSVLEGIPSPKLKKIMDERHGMKKSAFFDFARELRAEGLLEEREGMWFKKGNKFK